MLRAALAFFAFFAFCATLLVAFVLEGGRPVVLFRPFVPMVLMTSVSVGLALRLLFPYPVLARALADAGGARTSHPTSVVVWRVAERTSYGAGALALALILGLILTSNVLDQPPQVFGPKLGACVLMLGYGLLQGLAMALLRARVEAHRHPPELPA